MRLATVIDGHRSAVAVVREERLLVVDAVPARATSVREVAAGGTAALDRIASWADRQPAAAWRSRDEVVVGPAVPQPGAIYAIGLNYDDPAAGPDAPARPERPLVYGKASTSVTADGCAVTWDRSLTANVDGECELGVVIGAATGGTARVFGYTIVNDVSSRDPWLDGDQWLLGKSMPGFCPVGPWIVTADELDATDLALGCTIDGAPIQDGRTSLMRYPVPEIVSFLERHVALRPGDLVATGTPARLAAPPGPQRHLRPGDTVVAWIDGIGRLTNRIE